MVVPAAGLLVKALLHNHSAVCGNGILTQMAYLLAEDLADGAGAVLVDGILALQPANGGAANIIIITITMHYLIMFHFTMVQPAFHLPAFHHPEHITVEGQNASGQIKG